MKQITAKQYAKIRPFLPERFGNWSAVYARFAGPAAACSSGCSPRFGSRRRSERTRSASASTAPASRCIPTAPGRGRRMDRACEGDETRQLVRDLGMTPVVPPKANRKVKWNYDRETYKMRNEIERLFRRFKGYRRIFTRFDKLDATYLGFMSFVLSENSPKALKQNSPVRGLRICSGGHAPRNESSPKSHPIFGVKHLYARAHFIRSPAVPGMNGVCGLALSGAGMAFAGGPRCGPLAILWRRARLASGRLCRRLSGGRMLVAVVLHLLCADKSAGSVGHAECRSRWWKRGRCGMPPRSRRAGAGRFGVRVHGLEAGYKRGLDAAASGTVF